VLGSEVRSCDQRVIFWGTTLALPGLVLGKQRSAECHGARAIPATDAAAAMPRIVTLPPILYSGAFALGVVPRWLWPEPLVPLAIRLQVGLTLLVLGAGLAVWGNHVLQQAGTNADPALPTTALVVTGPFAFSRNPLYVARTLLYLGLAITMNMLWTLATLLPILLVMHYGVIRREERYLEAKFGSAYTRYRSRVRRWL
jgi:protein-S-isoprenylcysteine O-methyltransferase Ste14